MNSILQSVGDWFSDGIGGFFYNTCYMISASLCWIVGILDQVFSVMSGQTKVRLDGKAQTLMDVFVGNSVVQKVYWGMALIGILLCFMFSIIAVARKAVDSSDKMRQSMGGILTGLFKGILIIISMTFIFNAVLSLSNKLLTQITYTFNHADSLGEETSIEFTDEQYAAMARVLDTVANYSLNPSYDNRYNLNNCYNEIRGDLQYLMQQGVFDFYYDTEESGNSWQSAIQEIVNAANPGEDLAFDIYDDKVGDALLSCMKLMKTDKSFGPLRSYTRKYSNNDTNVPLDRLIFLSATMRAASNSVYNENASLEDPLRGAYYTEEKNIYDNTQVSKDFKLSDINYIALWAVALKLIWDLVVIIIDCVARIFNMIFLYLVAPPFIGVMPLDDGGKFKQWMTAFVVQCFGVFGTVIAMRVMLIFIPIIVNSNLVLFDNDMLNFAGKIILILGGMSTAKRASGVITGILADNAGYQAILASNMGDSVRKGLDHFRNRITGVGETGMWSGNGKGGLAGAAGKAWDKMTGSSSSGGGGSSSPTINFSRSAGGTKDTGSPVGESTADSGGGGDEAGGGTESAGATQNSSNPLTQSIIRLQGEGDAGPSPATQPNDDNQQPAAQQPQSNNQQRDLSRLFGAGYQAHIPNRNNQQGAQGGNQPPAAQQPAAQQPQNNNQQQGPQGDNQPPAAQQPAAQQPQNNNQQQGAQGGNQPPQNNNQQRDLSHLFGAGYQAHIPNRNNQQGAQGGNQPPAAQQPQNNNNQGGADNGPAQPQNNNQPPVAQQPQNNNNQGRDMNATYQNLFGVPYQAPAQANQQQQPQAQPIQQQNNNNQGQ